MDSTSQPAFSSPPLYPTQPPSIPDIVNGVQYGRGMMGAGPHNTIYDSRRLEGRVWESDWDWNNSRLTDHIMLPGMQSDQQPLYVNADMHRGSPHDFTQNTPHWYQLFGDSGVVLEAGAFVNDIPESLPQASAPLQAPAIYRSSRVQRHWSEVLSSHSTGLPFYQLARTQKAPSTMASFGVSDFIDSSLGTLSESSFWNTVPFQPLLSLSPSTPVVARSGPLGASPSSDEETFRGFDMTMNQAILAQFLSLEFQSAEYVPSTLDCCSAEPSIVNFEGSGADVVASAAQESRENAGNILVGRPTSPLRGSAALRGLSQEAITLITNAFTDTSPYPSPALRKLLDEVLQSAFLRKQEKEPLLSQAGGRSMVAKVVGLKGYDQIYLRQGDRSMYSLFVRKGSNRCPFCYSKKSALSRVVGCVRQHLGHRPFVCDGCGLCDENPKGPARFHTPFLLHDHVKSRTRKFACVYCDKALRRGGAKRHWKSMHAGIPFPYDEYPGYSRPESNESTSSANSEVLFSP